MAAARARGRRRRLVDDVSLTGRNLNPWCVAPEQVWATSVALHPNRPYEADATFIYSGLKTKDGIYVLSTRVVAGRPEWHGVAELALTVEQDGSTFRRTFLVSAAAKPNLIGLPFAARKGVISVSYAVRVANAEHWESSGLHIEPPRLVFLLDEGDGVRLYTAARASGGSALISANQGGLANRLLPFLSVVDLAAQAGRSSGVLWGPNAHCAANLEDLFDLAASGLSADGGDALVGLEGLFLDYEPEPAVLDLRKSDPAKPVVVHSIRTIAAEPYGRPSASAIATRFATLKPSSAVASRLDAFDRLDLHRMIGLHIRRPFPNGAFGRLERSKFILGDDNFYRSLIRDLQAVRSDLTGLFLATNDPKLERRLKLEFGDWVVAFEKRSIDNTRDVAAVQDALVDLMLLSRCKAVVSQRRSDFGFAAALFGRRPLYRLSPAEADGSLEVELWKDGELVTNRFYRPGESGSAFGGSESD